MRAFQALLYKEWIKLRRFVWIPPVLALGAISQCALTFNGFRAQHGAAIQMLDMVGRETIVFSLIRLALVLGGVCYAAAQFLADCGGRRLRLTFHLPVSSGWALRVMLLAGLLCCLATFVITEAVFAGVIVKFGFPAELRGPMLITLIPWGFGMLVAYCATAAFLAEPYFPRKLAYAAAGAAFIAMMAPESGYGVGNDWWFRAIICLLWIPVVEAAALRVKEGKG